MSGSVQPGASYADTPLTDAEKADIRRFCWYPTYGAGPAGFQSWRFFQEYGLLEFRMTNLAPAELQNVRWRLAMIYPAQAAFDAMYDTINVAQAAAFTRNPNELRERRAHMTALRRSLCDAVGVPPGPEFTGGATRQIIV